MKNKLIIRSIKKAIKIGFYALIFFPFIFQLESRSFHGDENQWIYTSKYFKLFFIDKDFENEQWKHLFAYDQPPVGRYIIGLALVIAGHKDRFEEINKMSFWDFSKNFSSNVSAGALPPQDILYAARLAMAILGALSCFLIYWLGKTVFSPSLGIISALLLAYNPLMLRCTQRAMTDSPLLFFMTANVALMVLFYFSLMKQATVKTIILAGLIGINTALATGTKVNGGLAGIIYAVFCIIIILEKIIPSGISFGIFGSVKKLFLDKAARIILISLLVSGTIAVFLFVGLNPYLYGQPLKGSVKMIEHRMEIVKGQQLKLGPAITSFSQKFISVFWRTLVDWRYTTLNYFLKIPLDLGLFLLGLGLLLYTEGKHFYRCHQISIQGIIFIWTFLTFIGTMLWIPLDWDRYYLPFVPCVAMLSGYGLDKLLGTCWRRLRRRENNVNISAFVMTLRCF